MRRKYDIEYVKGMRLTSQGRYSLDNYTMKCIKKYELLNEYIVHDYDHVSFKNITDDNKDSILANAIPRAYEEENP